MVGVGVPDARDSSQGFAGLFMLFLFQKKKKKKRKREKAEKIVKDQQTTTARERKKCRVCHHALFSPNKNEKWRK